MPCTTTSAPHKARDPQTWLCRLKRFTFHFTPMSASWLNQFVAWFGILTRHAIRRDSSGAVKELVAMICASAHQERWCHPTRQEQDRRRDPRQCRLQEASDQRTGTHERGDTLMRAAICSFALGAL
jgi:hypothetical protein